MKYTAAMFILAVAAILAGRSLLPAATQPAPQASGDWTKLYQDEAWYKAQTQPEQIYAGILSKLPDDDKMTTLMRSHRYELNAQVIYPATVNPALDALLGKKVEIRGKMVSQELEGTALTELYPGAVRLAAPTTSPTTAPTTRVAVKFDTYDGYFVSNQFEPEEAESKLIITDQASFDKVFGVGMVMNDQSHRIPKDLFDTQIVVALIRRGHTPWQYSDVSVTSVSGILTVHYSAMGLANPNATFASPLIISVAKGEYHDVRFVIDALKAPLMTPVKAQP